MTRPQRCHSPELSQGRHFLYMVGLRERLVVADTASEGVAEGRVHWEWRHPTEGEYKRFLRKPEGWVLPDGTSRCVLQFFSIPPRMRRSFANIRSGRADEGTVLTPEDPLITRLVDFLAFIAAPLKGPCSITLECADRDAEIASPSEPSRDPGTDSLGARVNVGDSQLELVVETLPESANNRREAPAGPRWLRITLFPNEGFFANLGAVRHWLVAGDTAADTRVLSIRPD